MINFNRIEAEIFLGSAPQNNVDASRLTQMKITSVLSLQSDHDLRSHKIDLTKLESAYQYNDITLKRFPIIDFDEVDLGMQEFAVRQQLFWGICVITEA